jgi:hypothetical protein
MPVKPHFLLLIAALLSMTCAAHAQENAYEAGREGRIAVTKQYVDKAKQIIRANIALTTPNSVALFSRPATASQLSRSIECACKMRYYDIQLDSALSGGQYHDCGAGSPTW